MDKEQAEKLGKWLRQIGTLKGEADLSGIMKDYDTWYRETQKRFEERENIELANAFFNRFKGLVLKLAVIREASVSGSLKVSEDAWHWSKTKAKELEDIIFSMLATGMTGAGFVQQRMEQVIEEAGPEGMPQSKLSRAFQDHKERIASLYNLLKQEKVFLFKRPGRMVKVARATFTFTPSTMKRRLLCTENPTRFRAYEQNALPPVFFQFCQHSFKWGFDRM